MPMLSGSAGSERSHVSSMSGSACFSACLRSFSASRSSSRVLNLSVSAFFVLMGFGGSCGFRCFFFFAYKYLYTCLAGTPAQPYSHKG